VKLPTATALAVLLSASPARGAPPDPAPVSACVDCHLALDDPRLTPPATAFADDLHARAGFTCAACHGGDPKAEDQDAAHDRRKGFRGKPGPRDIPVLCGTCHGDAAVMKRYNPSLRVDQLVEYRTSGHGRALAKGDATVATCVSCHGAHGVLPVKDARSPVYPLRMAETCNRCHGDAGLMTAHKLPSDVYPQYQKSVHFETLTKKGDLSAPTCNSCHGNHGAAPPNVASVANVCGTCHSIFADQFKASPHEKPFAEMGLPGCVTCHENHAIVHPTDEFLADGADSKCASCHEPGTKGAEAAAAMYASLRRLHEDTAAAKAMLRIEAEAGMEVSKVQFELAQADEALTKARTDVHYFDPAAVQKAVAGGLAVTRSAVSAAVRIHGEREFRRKGLFASLGLILVAIAALAVKIRDLDRRRRP
jgi:cytochrome c553